MEQLDANQLANEINGALEILGKESSILSKLPRGSWAAYATHEHNVLLVEILKNNSMLFTSGWYELEIDETYWRQFIIPLVARLLAKHQPNLPDGLLIKFRINFRVGPNELFCSADKLAREAQSISRGDSASFGRMMSLLDFE